MIWTLWIALGAAFCGLGVVLGAFVTHSLKDRLNADRLRVFETGVRYQMMHGLGLILIGNLATRMEGTLLSLAGIFLALGTLLFSGSLYLLAAKSAGAGKMVYLTPLGGLLLVVGWLMLSFSALLLPL